MDKIAVQDRAQLLQGWALAWAEARNSDASAYRRASAALAAAAAAKTIGDLYGVASVDRAVWDDLHRSASLIAVQMDALDLHPDRDPEEVVAAALEQEDAAHSIPTKQAAEMLHMTPRGVRAIAKTRRYGVHRGRDLYLTLAEVNALREVHPGRPRKVTA